LEIFGVNQNVPMSPSINSLKNNLDSLFGKRIKVYWPEYDQYFNGTIEGLTTIDKNDGGGTHDVLYDDDKEIGNDSISEHLFGDQKVEWEFL